MSLWIETPLASISYTLNRKKIKNMNIRIAAGGRVMVSAPLKLPARDIENFIRSKAGWILKNQQKMMLRPAAGPCKYSKEECLQRFTAISDSIFPLFADLLQGEKPLIKVREMKTRWGVCNIAKKTITLNTRLAEQPMAAVEYVVLHEYVHFLHPHHQKAFHTEMARLMPDYKARRKLLAG